eukprot:1190376-Prorocentrum_minimum.AAC.2
MDITGAECHRSENPSGVFLPLVCNPLERARYQGSTPTCAAPYRTDRRIVDLKGCIVDLKGYRVDLKGYSVDLKGYSADI